MAVAKQLQGALGTMTSASLVGIALGIYLLLTAINKFLLHLQRRSFAAANGCQPPKAYPLRDPILGIDEVLRRIRRAREKRVLEHIQSTFTTTAAKTYSTTALGLNVISTLEPENVKTILSLKFKDFGIGNRIHTLGRLLGKGIFTMDGDHWQHSRAMIRPNFAKDQVADLEAFERHMQTMLTILPRDGSTVDLQELFFRFTIDSATEFLFGKGTSSLKAGSEAASVVGERDFATDFNKALHAITMTARLGKLGRYMWWVRDKEGEEAIRACHTFVDRYVDEAVRYREKAEAREGEKENYVFLHQLAKETTDKRQLRDELLNVLLAGRDTTASLLSNMWFMLAKHQHVFEKLRREVQETLQGRAPTYEELRNIKYLKYCMNESLRLHPVVPVNGRIAFKDTVIPVGGGPDGKSPVFVAKGTLVQYPTYVMHRRKDFYGEDAEDFRPERWESLRPGWEYLPFNGGPRICLGQQYALTEAGYVTVRLLQEFSGLEARDPEPWMEGLTLTLCSGNGTMVGLTPA